ncbi:homoprotocatechuate degradation operon regulator HpaR [Alcaligenes sp. SDU_A2]|uniref:homoprotocatechuate degradation operon regulator HpaR n=1 Tax=Alcaligenes sp. SDU_A2 TaxID=3136634 RepID=UPI00311D603E
MPSTFKHRNLPHLFLSAREALMLRFRPVLNEAGISEQQWRVLRILSDTDSLDAATLAQQAQILAPSLTRMLRGLEQAGLIQRGADPTDLRRQVIRLSTQGRYTVTELSPRIEAIYQELEQAIGPELLQAIYDKIDRMIERIQQP